MKIIHTHYDNLKIARNAPIEVIRAAYKSLAQKYHPDKNPGDAEAARIMLILNDSYAILSDPGQRKQHDSWVAEMERKAAGPVPSPFPIPPIPPIPAPNSQQAPPSTAQASVGSKSSIRSPAGTAKSRRIGSRWAALINRDITSFFTSSKRSIGSEWAILFILLYVAFKILGW